MDLYTEGLDERCTDAMIRHSTTRVRAHTVIAYEPMPSLDTQAPDVGAVTMRSARSRARSQSGRVPCAAPRRP